MAETNEERRSVTIYTDGACIGNPGPGGYGVILKYGAAAKELSGGEASTTNNRMELTAAVKGLSALKFPCDVTLVSDSQYLVNAFRLGWIERWEQKGWKRPKSGPIPNTDLWKELQRLCSVHSVRFVWVRGHDGHPENERCDRLARSEAEKHAAGSGAGEAE